MVRFGEHGRLGFVDDPAVLGPSPLLFEQVEEIVLVGLDDSHQQQGRDEQESVQIPGEVRAVGDWFVGIELSEQIDDDLEGHDP